MERPAQLTVRSRRFSLPKGAAIAGALMFEAAAIWFVATGLAFRNPAFFAHPIQVEFLQAKPPKPRPVVLPQLQLLEPPPVPEMPPPEIQIRTPRPPPHITAAKISRRAVMRPPVQIVRALAPPAPPKSPGITAPVSIGASHSCERRYPALAVRLNQRGTTTVGFLVDSSGGVANVHVVNSSGHEMLDDAAIRCASSWRYRPALENGHPVPAPWTANVQWNLRNGYPSM